MKTKIISILFLFIFISSICFAAQEPKKWERLEKDSVDYKIYFDAESVYQSEDGTVFFWFKYVPLSQETLDFYSSAIKNHLESNEPGSSERLSNEIYCLYQIQADYEQNTYQLLQHYWFNTKDDSFVTSYVNHDGWQKILAEDDFAYIRTKIKNNQEKE